MKQIFQYAPFLFFDKKELMGSCGKDHLETICKDSDGVYFLSTVIEELTNNNELKKKRIIYEDSDDEDFNAFLIKNGLYNDNCKIYLN